MIYIEKRPGEISRGYHLVMTFTVRHGNSPCYENGENSQDPIPKATESVSPVTSRPKVLWKQRKEPGSVHASLDPSDHRWVFYPHFCFLQSHSWWFEAPNFVWSSPLIRVSKLISSRFIGNQPADFRRPCREKQLFILASLYGCVWK